MTRTPATAATAVVGATVFTSRTGRVARTVVAVERDLLDTAGQPLIMATRWGYSEMAFAVSELWVEAPR